MKLEKLLNNLDYIELKADLNQEISDITADSRKVSAGSLFIAVRGFSSDGHKFIKDVFSNGVKIVVCEDKTAVSEIDGLSYILVNNSRKAMAIIAGNFYDNPADKLLLTGITGTKGKTTTAFLIKSVHETNSNKSLLLGTIANIIGSEISESKLTTPESLYINEFFNKAVQEGCKTGVMEVSSHALELNRVDNIKFNIAVFTNLDSDHMDFHKTKENYLNAKKKLFDNLADSSFAVVNCDSLVWEEMVKDCKAGIVTYGFSEKADYKISNLEYDLNGTKFNLLNKENNYLIETPLIGKFNSYNAASAFICGILSGYDSAKTSEGIKNAPQVPGRFEIVYNKNKTVIVDYSHTAESLRQALLVIKEINKSGKNVTTVFGCGGDRDITKRPEMGRIATELSDFVIVTSDNPRSENPDEIIRQIEAGINKQNYCLIENRTEAIRKAVQESEENSIILIAGKGHENYQEINGKRTYFSDKETALGFLI